MRKIILQCAVTLDGYIEGPQGEYDWCFTDRDYGMSAFLERIDAIFYGRKSYEMMNKEGASSGQDLFGGKKSYVFSTTLKSVSGGAEIVQGDIRANVGKLKAMAGKDIWLFGGASLTRSLINEGLVDELHLAVHPLLLGSGRLLFGGIQGRVKTKLIDVETYDSGLVMMRYSCA